MKLMHSADWQIGARFRQFGEAAARLRAARVRTLRRALEEAARAAVEGFVVAGDLFEDNEVDAATVAAVLEVLADFPHVPIFLLPGNHDPFTGPASVWGRAPLSAPPAHVRVFREPEAVAVGDGWLLASPLRQKNSAVDPSLALRELVAALPPGTIKAGVTHGSPMIEGKHHADDFPIALDAATRAGLDFLGIGHWHGRFMLDGGRMLMAGTPETTSFSEGENGFVHLVEIERAGALPRVTAVAVGELRWFSASLDLTHGAHSEQALGGWREEDAPRTVARIVLRGSAAPRAVEECRAALLARLAGCVFAEVRDETAPELTEEDLQAWRQEHPLLTEVLADLQALAAGGAPRFSPPEAAGLAERAGFGTAELSPELIATARRMMLHTFRESCGSC